MRCSSDFECGNGKNFVRVAPLQWRMNVRGDMGGYGHYFSFRLDVEREGGLCEIDVLPDPDLLTPLAGTPQQPWAHPPGMLWSKRGSDGPWERIVPDMFDASPGKIRIRWPVRPGEVWYFSEMCPLPPSDIARHLQDLPNHSPHVRARQLGETPERRPLLAARVTDPDVPTAEKGKVFILAGQHGTEFAGMFAAKGALDLLASRLPQAAAMRRRYVFDILPCANPDGSAHGIGCFNSEGKDQLKAFKNAARGTEPATAEAQLIWRHLTENTPDLIINFHAYAHPRPFGDPPFEGMYVPDPDRLADRERRAMQHVLNHALFYLTHAGSQHRRPCPQRAHTLEESAATAWGALSVLYQVQAEEGPHRNLLTGGSVLVTVMETLELAQKERIGLG